MKIKDHKSLQSFIDKNRDKQQICNNYIFDVFFNEILKINQVPFYIELRIKDSYELTLSSETNQSIMICFNLWRSQVNIFLGQELLHYADDVFLKNNNDLIEFRNELSILFTSRIKEELLYNNDKLKKYKYKFHQKHKCIKEYKSFLFNSKKILYIHTKNKENYIIENKYDPWILK